MFRPPDDEEVKVEKKTEKKRIEVVWNELKFEFVWRVGTPTHLLVFRLSRMLDPLADCSRLILTDTDGMVVELCDAMENLASFAAKFVDVPAAAAGGLTPQPQPVALPAAQPTYNATVVAIPSPQVIPEASPVKRASTSRGGTTSYVQVCDVAVAQPSACPDGIVAFPQTLKRKRQPNGTSSTGSTTGTVEDEFTKYQREGFLLLRKVVRKAVKASRYLNGTGIYGVYVRDSMC